MTEKFKRLCLVRADVSKLVGVPLNRMLGAHDMYKKPYRLILRFGGEKTAQISWMENVSDRWLVMYAISRVHAHGTPAERRETVSVRIVSVTRKSRHHLTGVPRN